MNTSSMDEMTVGFSAAEVLDEYERTLKEHLQGGGEVTLQRGYELSRNALARGVGLLEILGACHRVLRSCLDGSPAEKKAGLIDKAEHFLVETLTPFEMAYRGFRDANSALRTLNEKMEQEIRRIAHALHDEVAQLVASVQITLDGLSIEFPPALQKRLEMATDSLDEVEEQLRQLSHELRPRMLDDLGLLPALDFIAQNFSRRTGIRISVEGATEGRLPFSVETALYRIALEALNNISRHSRATAARISVGRKNQSVRCSVWDNGVGFNISEVLYGNQGLGLLGIRERLDALGGSLEINSAPGQGTTLLIALPIPSDAA